MWTSDSFGVVGSIRFVKPIYSVIGLAPFCYGVISSHHIVAGFFGITLGLWHISSRPGISLYKLLKMGNVEEVLSSSIPPVLFTACVISAKMWYGCVSAALELCGPSRYHWDNAYFYQLIKHASHSKIYPFHQWWYDALPLLNKFSFFFHHHVFTLLCMRVYVIYITIYYSIWFIWKVHFHCGGGVMH